MLYPVRQLAIYNMNRRNIQVYYGLQHGLADFTIENQVIQGKGIVTPFLVSLLNHILYTQPIGSVHDEDRRRCFWKKKSIGVGHPK
jgi:hypothetical protein